MVYENINIDDPNFSLGPQAGTYCTIDLSDQALKVVNETGNQQGPLYSLSSNINNTLFSLEYTGPLNYTGMMDEVTFFTLEKVSSTQCLIKRWEINTGGSSLDLKQTITKTTGGADYYDALGMAVEYYRRSFAVSNPGGINYLDIDDASRITSGMRLFLGPSTDVDNPGAGEYVTVDTVSGTRVYLTGNIVNEYVGPEGPFGADDICFYKNIYLVSALGHLGDASKGTIFKLDASTGVVLQTDNQGVYQKTTAARWSPYVTAVVCVASTNAIFVRPYNSYSNWKSMFLNNVESDKATVFDVHDILFKDYEVYKLMQKVTLRDDSGDQTTYTWTKYNYRQDTLLPYTNSIDLYTSKSMMIGGNDTTTLNIRVLDQFGIGLLNVTVDVDVTNQGLVGAVLNPVDGIVITDANGEASVGYTSGTTYDDDLVEVTVNDPIGGFTGHGSSYVWNSTHIDNKIEYYDEGHLYQFDSEFEVEAYIVKQIAQQMSNNIKLFCKSFFTTPGGDWINPSPYVGEVSTYLPALIVGNNDGPAQSFSRNWNPGDPGTPPSFENRITQLTAFESEGYFRQISNDFDGDFKWIKQLKECAKNLKIDQMKLSKHGYYVAPTWYDYLWTRVSLNQFVFVQDAIPVFWSEKNPVDTNIWLRLRPYASDLNSATLNFSVREVWYDGDTGYQDFISYCTVTTWAAPGGLGLDILCNPPQDFHHNALVYVHLDLRDVLGNYIELDYWFKIIPDYKAPYLDNLNPDRDQTSVDVDTNIYFEIKDLGVGVDIDSLELCVNSKRVTPSTNKISNQHYEITYDPSTDFYYDKEILVSVRVQDLSEFNNTLIDSYRFYTAESADVLFVNLDPKICKRGFPRFQDVSFLALGAGSGVDLATLKVQIHNLDIENNKLNILPVVYRIE